MNFMLRRFLPILLTLAAALPAGAQSIRLTPYQAPSALYADIGSLFNYNLYEHARFEAGLSWVQPNESARRTAGGNNSESPKVFLGQWTLSGYVAYGVYDKAWKYGGSWSLRLPGHHDVRVGMSVKDDLEQAASRRMEDYNMVQTSMNNSYVASRFSHVQAVEGKVSWKFASQWKASVTARYSREQELFRMSAQTLGDSPQPWVHYTEAALRLGSNHLALLVQPGVAFTKNSQPYLRLLAQYTYGDLRKGLHLWAQAGYATALCQGRHSMAPESRRFDISGTSGTPYYFEHTFLTIPPNQEYTNLFAHLCAKYTAPEPLWKSSFSNPRPFLQANIAIADYRGINPCLLNESPYGALLEPATGFDGIIRWGILDMGFAVAYRVIPLDTLNPKNNLALAIVAQLIV